MAGNRVISSDRHIIEPPDLWASRMEPGYKDRAPRAVDVEGGQVWLVDDVRTVSFVQGAQASLRFTDPEKLGFMDTFENVRPGGYIPDEAIKDMDTDGIDVAVLYPTEAAAIYH